ncbi:hypothetical protein HLH44_03555 [Gluconacetobacter sp. 1c LMG 22058]|uniref:Tail fiber protein n=1 Tax=Gluconacetobacter dulcium TaxID=2729096 RepID=A0A7W4JXR3_9PROT|nr:hypothetical protein [Gluconacetobacter dulcium]MBB2196547.1 hypothetical protein [Gluconacetobacter dulcium]
MYQIDTSAAVAEMPAMGAPGNPGWFDGGDPVSGRGPTYIDPDWLNMLQAELMAILALGSVSQNKTETNQIASVISALIANAIVGEAVARANADAALQTNLTAEATARANADSAEATARAAADGTLQTNLTAEATARANADSAEAATRAAADGTLQTNLTAEATARANADSAEAATRASADGTLQTNLTAEAAARANGDSAEAATRAAMDGALQARLDAISAGAGIANGHNYSWIVVNGYMSLSFTFENDATGTTQTIPLPKAFGGDITSVVINSMTKDNDVWVFNFTPTSFDMRTPNGGTNTFSAIAMGPAWSAS